MPFRAPGGVWLSSIVLFCAACGDDGTATSGVGGDATSSTDATTTTFSAASGSVASTGVDAGGAAPASTATGDGAGGAGQGGAGGQSAGSGEGGTDQGGGGASTGGSGGGGGGGDASTSATGGQGGSGGEAAGSGGGVPAGARVRIVSANLTTGNNQSYDPGHGIRILQGIDGDIILVQEMNYGANNAAAMRSLTDQICGSECDWAREPVAGNGSLPNGVVSRYPIVDSGIWDDTHVSNRELFWARIDMPGPGDLLAVSVHLHTNVSSHPDEGATLVDEILAASGPDDLVVLGGDFNTDDTTDLLFAELDDFFRVTEPYPVDNLGNPNSNGNRNKRYDWVLADPGLDALEIPVVIGAQVFATGLVVDTRVYTPLTDIAPALLDDSSPSVSMQHMAIVRDFAFAD